MKKNTLRVMALLLILILALAPSLVMAEINPPEGDDPITYIAKAKSALKMRKDANTHAGGNGSIDKGSYVYIVMLGPEWSQVRNERLSTGYVLTKYLEDIRSFDDETDTIGDPVSINELFQMTIVVDDKKIEAKYVASTVGNALMYEEASDESRVVDEIPIYKDLYVVSHDGEWALCTYKNRTGYIRVRKLFKWDRIDPYAGEIPGLDVCTKLAYTNKLTTIYSLETGEELAEVNAGTAHSVIRIDEQGRYLVPYWREIGYINPEDIVTSVDVVPYDQAQPGDLISSFTTYFAVGITAPLYQGRNWNIHYAASMINGTILQPNEEYNMNKTIGRYIESTGYKKSPIMSPHALWGYGGGTCQTTTTFYNTNIQVPILVTHRRVHADVGIYYAKKGFDAAVGGGDINLTLVNTLPYAIRYQFHNSDGVLNCNIYREY